MFTFTVTCKGAKTVIGEFIGWHQLEQLIDTQCSEPVWNWFDMLIHSKHLLDIVAEHLVTTASNGMTVVYGIEVTANSQ